MIRGKRVEDAVTILKFTNKKAARIILKVLQSAVANGESSGKVDVETLDGKVGLTIPPGVQPGQKLRLRGRGITDHRGRTGHHFVRIRVTIPRRLTAEQRRILEKNQRARLIEQQIRYAENNAWLARRAGNYVLERQYASQISELRRQLMWLQQEIAREQARLDQLANQLRAIEDIMTLEALGRLGKIYKRETR